MYQNRNKFNNYVTDLLGKDALLHEISNSDSSSSSNNPFDFLTKASKKSPATIYNDYDINQPKIAITNSIAKDLRE